MRCDECLFYVFDDDYQEFVCDANVDEDDYDRMLERGGKECPYWRDGDEYKVVRHQM